VRIEFEFKSRNFRDHGHSPQGCDIIVCWRHNWPECPPHLEVVRMSRPLLELSRDFGRTLTRPPSSCQPLSSAPPRAPRGTCDP
jgi:hypothetical protein